jgi:phosphatidylinositol glycan class S
MASGASPKNPAAAPADTAAPEPKMPPPEKPADVRRRSHIILSFWLIVLLLGLPIWWMTTTIYRANLPLDGMIDWANGKVGSPIPGFVAPG